MSVSTVETVTLAGYEFQHTRYTDGVRVIDLGEFEIDYDQNLYELVSEGNFEVEPIYDLELAAIHYATCKQIGVEKRRLFLMNNRSLSRVTSVENWDKPNPFSADIFQLLNVAKRFPAMQKEISVMILWRRRTTFESVPTLDSVNGQRRYGLQAVCGAWLDEDWTLAL